MQITLQVENNSYNFSQYPIIFEETKFKNVFSKKNNKTLSETLEHKRYKSLKARCNQDYKSLIDMPLGDFVLHLKNLNDEFFKNFLNKHGDLTYSKFYLEDSRIFDSKGIYLYTKSDELVYIGRCRDSIKKRINHGYGKITPKNCFKDGQSTNCHLNHKITCNSVDINFWFCEISDVDSITRIEKQLINEYKPSWNINK